MQGVFEFFAAKGNPQSPVGLQIMVHGLVPQGEQAGLWPAPGPVLAVMPSMTVGCHALSREASAHSTRSAEPTRSAMSSTFSRSAERPASLDS